MSADLAAEAWRNGPLRGLRHGPEVMFGQVREDTALEASLSKGNVLCIASGGETAFMALTGADHVTAIDINPAQIYLVELKMAAIRRLWLSQLLSLLYRDARPRYPDLRDRLSPECRSFFDSRVESLGRGLVNCGKADEAIRRLMSAFFVCVHRKARVRALIERGDVSGWDSWRWRAAIGLIMNRPVLSAVFGLTFGQAVPAGFAKQFRAGALQAIREGTPGQNPYLAQAFSCESSFGAMFDWLEDKRLEKLRDRLDQIAFRVEDVTDFAAGAVPNSFDRVFLSNILDGTALQYRTRLAKALARILKPGGLTVSRSFFTTPSGLDNLSNGRLVKLETPDHIDRSFFCRNVEVYECR